MRIRNYLALGTLLLLASPAAAQISYTGTTYSQNFDTLASSGNNNPWVNNTTILGWYSNRTTYKASAGGANSADLYSFGVAGIHPVTERALGSEATQSSGQIFYGMQLRNDTGLVLTQFTLTYTGEQWRNSGGQALAQTLFVEYLVTASAANQITAGGYTATPSLNFSNPTGGTPSGPIDGNDPANQTLISDTITGFTWNPGEYLWIRFRDPVNLNGSNNNLAIDDLGFVAVPEPWTIALFGAAGAGVVGYWRYRRRLGQSADIEQKADEEAEGEAEIESPD